LSLRYVRSSDRTFKPAKNPGFSPRDMSSYGRLDTREITPQSFSTTTYLVVILAKPESLY
jgi:hypothetical protein